MDQVSAEVIPRMFNVLVRLVDIQLPLGAALLMISINISLILQGLCTKCEDSILYTDQFLIFKWTILES